MSFFRAPLLGWAAVLDNQRNPSSFSRAVSHAPAVKILWEGGRNKRFREGGTEGWLGTLGEAIRCSSHRSDASSLPR
jgi:hypothetical protein